MEKNLREMYKEWRETTEELNKTDFVQSPVDCGEGSARESFSAYAGLNKEITFEEMLELEKDYEA